MEKKKDEEQARPGHLTTRDSIKGKEEDRGDAPTTDPTTGAPVHGNPFETTPPPSAGVARPATDEERRAAEALSKAHPPAGKAGEKKEHTARTGLSRHILIDDERIEYTGIKNFNLLNVRRGSHGTKPAAHEAGTEVKFVERSSGVVSAHTRLAKKLEVGDVIITLDSTDGFPT